MERIGKNEFYYKVMQSSVKINNKTEIKRYNT